MQTPTPPTRPTPPTPPTVNPKSSENSAADQPSSPPASNSINADKSATVKTPTEGKTTSPPPATTKKAASPSSTDNTPVPAQPSLGTYQETSSQTASAPTVSTSKNKPSPFGFGFFFSLVLLIAISLTCFRLWKNTHKKQRTILNYSADSPQDLLNLMNSAATASPSPQKIVQGKNKSSSKIKGNFEVRI